MPSRQQVLAQISRYLQQLPVEERYLAVYEMNAAAQASQAMNESTEFERRRANWREQNETARARRQAIEAAMRRE
jgi:hypothetical protein